VKSEKKSQGLREPVNMEKRVKTFWYKNPCGLDEEINKFLSITNGKLHEIMFHFSPENECVQGPTLIAMLIYTPEEEE
jgi:hypothetical protein